MAATAAVVPNAAQRNADAWGTGWNDLNKTRFYCASVTSSLLVRAIIYPINMAKTRVQHSGVSARAQGGTVSMLRAVVQEHGIGRLYRGFVLSTAVGVIGGPFYLTVLERSRAFYTDSLGIPATVASMCAAATGTLSTQLWLVPTDNVVQRLMVARGSGSSSATAAGAAPAGEADAAAGAAGRSGVAQVRALYAAGGVRSFYRGVGVSLFVYGPAGVIFWGVYPHTRQALDRLVSHTCSAPQLGWVATPVASGLTGAAAMALTTPLDAIKTRFQLSDKAGATAVSVARDLVREQGPKGLLLGMRMRVSQGVFMYAVMLSAYESIKWYSREEEPRMASSTRESAAAA